MNFLSFPFTEVTNKVPFFFFWVRKITKWATLWLDTTNLQQHSLRCVFLFCSKAGKGVWDLCKGCLTGHCQRKRRVFNNNSHFSPFYLPPRCKCLKNLWFCSGKDNGTFSSIMKPPCCALKIWAVFKCASTDLDSLKAWCTPLWRQNF